MKLSIIQRYSIVESIKCLRIKYHGNIPSCFLISSWNPDSLLINFACLTISKLTLFIIDNIHSIIVNYFAKIERNGSISCCTCEIQNVIVIWNMKILSKELLWMLIDICVMSRTMWKFWIAKFRVIEVPELGIDAC